MNTIVRVAEKLAIALFSSIYMDYDRPATVGVISATQIDIVQAARRSSILAAARTWIALRWIVATQNSAKLQKA